MRIHKLFGILILGLFFLSTQNLTRALTHEAQVQYNARLKVMSKADLDRHLRAPFGDGVAHPAGILNCRQLLVRKGHLPQASSQEFQSERSTMAECVVFQKLRRAVPARSSYVHDLAWDEHVLPLLPPQLAITVSAESTRAAGVAANQGRGWQDFDPSVTAGASSKGPEEIVVAGNGFSERLVLWGRGDFNGDGVEDLLVQSFDSLTDGTYRNTRIFLLTRHAANGRLSVVGSPF